MRQNEYLWSKGLKLSIVWYKIRYILIVLDCATDPRTPRPSRMLASVIISMSVNHRLLTSPTVNSGTGFELDTFG